MKLIETSLTRVWQHITGEGKCMIAISAMRDEIEDLQVLKQLNSSLKVDIKKGGFGFTQVTGGFTENKGTPNEKDVEEKSFLVFFNDDRLEEAKIYFTALCRKYNQDAYLLVNNGEAKFIDKQGNEDKLGKWSPKQLDAYFTKLKNGRKFSFDTAVLGEDMEGANGLSPTGHRQSDKVLKALKISIAQNISFEEAYGGKNHNLTVELNESIYNKFL